MPAILTNNDCLQQRPAGQRAASPVSREADQIRERDTSASSNLLQPLRAWSSFSCDAGSLQPSLLELEKRLHFGRCCCNEEGQGSVEINDTRKNNWASTAVCCHSLLDSGKVSDAGMSKQEVLCFLNHELEQERIAAESAANEAISMILRLQVEKAALQMEARHYRQVLEARTLYDEETISHLKDIISSQEADRLVLEREINECRQTLRKYSEIVMDNRPQVGHIGQTDDGEDLMMAAGVPSHTKMTLDGLSLLDSDQSFRPLCLEEKFKYGTVRSVEDAHQYEVPLLEAKEDTKTKYVVSISTSGPIPNAGPINFAFEGLTMTHGTCLRMLDCQFGNVELEGVKVDSATTEGNCLDDVVRDCWLGILIKLSNLQKRIWNSEAVGFSGLEADRTPLKHQEYCLNSRGGLTKLQQKFPLKCVDCGEESLCAVCEPDAFKPQEYKLSQKLLLHDLKARVEMLPRMPESCWTIPASKSEHTNTLVKDEVLYCKCNKNCKVLHEHGRIGEARIRTNLDLWRDLMVITDSCVMALEKNFATCRSRLHALDAARKVMTEALKTSKENRGKADKVLVIAADIMKDFVSFTSLGCDILDLLHNLVTHLTEVARLEASSAKSDLDSGSKLNTCVMAQDNRPVAGEEGPETGVALIQRSDSYLPQHMDSKMSQLAFLWSSSLEWMSNEKCRAETAFSGWDRI